MLLLLTGGPGGAGHDIDLPGYDGSEAQPGVDVEVDTPTIYVGGYDGSEPDQPGVIVDVGAVGQDIDLPGYDGSVAQPGVDVIHALVTIDLGGYDGSLAFQPGPASVILVDGTAVHEIELGGFDGSSEPTGPIVKLIPLPWSGFITYPAGARVTHEGIVYITPAGAAAAPDFASQVGTDWIIFEEYKPSAYAYLYDRDGNLLSTLDNAYGVEWQDHFNDVGSGSLQLPADDPDAGLLVAGTEVRCFIYETGPWFAWELAKNPSATLIDQGEEQQQNISADGRGRASLLDRARIFPVKGLGEQFMGQHRLYSFASPDFPNVPAGWVPATQGLRQDQIDPIRQAHIEVTTVLEGGLGDIVEMVPAPAPLGWQIFDAFWIWGTPDTLEIGFCYFRRQFTLGTTTAVVIAATGDNYWTLFLDGIPILGTTGDDGNGWQQHRRLEVTLPAGTYLLAAVVENIFVVDIPPENNPAGWLCAVYTVDDDNHVIATILKTDSSWDVLGYPPQTPGWTPGQIILNAVGEAQARGLLAGFDCDFTAFADSSGNSWQGITGPSSFVAGFSTPVGSTILDVLRQLVDEGWVDWRVKPGGKTLQMWNQNQSGQTTTIQFAQTFDRVTQNLVSASYEPQTEATTRLFVKWSAGYFDLEDVAAMAQYGVYEGFVTIDAANEAEARRQGQLILDDVANPKTAIVVAIDPAGDDDKPYLEFTVGDMVAVPSRAGVLTFYKVQGITVTQTDMGRSEVTLELDTRLTYREREAAKLLETLGKGVVGSTKIRNAMDKTTGTIHG